MFSALHQKCGRNLRVPRDTKESTYSVAVAGWRVRTQTHKENEYTYEHTTHSVSTRDITATYAALLLRTTRSVRLLVCVICIITLAYYAGDDFHNVILAPEAAESSLHYMYILYIQVHGAPRYTAESRQGGRGGVAVGESGWCM